MRATDSALCLECNTPYQRRRDRPNPFCSLRCHGLHRVKDPKEVFFSKALKTESCWLWTGYVDKNGYGSISINGKPFLVHRYSFILHHGDIPGGLLVMHSCDVRNCVNPEHLSVGTHKDNSSDMVKKGRQPRMRGELSGRSKLTRAQVEEIRDLRAKGFSLTFLARKYGISRGNVANISRFRIWKNY